MTVEVGQRLGERFTVERAVHIGAMSAVYQARDGVTGAPVALKVPRAEPERFRQECELLARLSSPRIVRHLAHGGDAAVADAASLPYLAMEWLEGETLQKRLSRGALPLNEALQVVHGLAEGLLALHRADVVHRDIKPANAFLIDGRPERVTIIDLGVARRTARGLAAHVDFGGGTWAYMSPEQALGAAELGPRADLFALGCVLYECVAGTRAYPGDRAQVVRAKVWRDPPRLRAAVPGVPAPVEALQLRLMERDPSRRPADAAAALGELARLLTSSRLPPGGAS
jgi:serine/threonine protein kinase